LSRIRTTWVIDLALELDSNPLRLSGGSCVRLQLLIHK
jgi:hypothetical protein